MMNGINLKYKVEEFIKRYSLLDSVSGTTVISTLSGGADSVALLVILKELGFNCVAAHCNYHLRGDESNRDERYARVLTANLGVKIVVADFDVESARSNCPGCKSIEMICRELRYDWFEKLRKEYSAQAIAVAHNADDNVETLLLNLLRGTGIAGVRGMLPKTPRNVVRPLLECSRGEIESYLASKEIPYIVDSTNLQSEYKRNCIRNEIIPLVRKFFPSSELTLKKSLASLREDEGFFTSKITELHDKYVAPNGNINLVSLKANEVYSSLLLYEWLKVEGFSRADVDNMLNCIESGRRFEVDSMMFVYHDGILRRVEKRDDTASFEDCFEITQHPIDEFCVEYRKDVAYFDADVLKTYQLGTRKWKNGDWIEPYGMSGRKKLSDLFVDSSVPIDVKSRIPLLMAGEIILWVPLLRASSAYKVTKSTKSYLRVRYIGPTLF